MFNCFLKINKINMDALKSIPKILDNINDLHKITDAESALAEYKKSVKNFINAITSEVAHLIDKYEQKIKALAQENKRLKQGTSPAKEKSNSSPRLSPMKSPPSRMPSPIKAFKNIQMMQTAKSNLFTAYNTNFEEGQRFSSVLAKYQNNEDHNFPLELINPEPADDYNHKQSRFEVKTQRKKQKEEDLRHFLQTGKKSMRATTDRFLSAIGRDQPTIESNIPKKQLQRDHSDSSQSFGKRSETSLNKSLGNICQSLDTSFYSKKARSQNKKKRQKVQEEIQLKQRRDEEMNKMLKDKGIKNLLQRLRDNVEASAQRPLQVIKSSKLISSGKGDVKSKQPPSQNVESPGRSRRGSKVLFNPVPVDIGQKSKAHQKDSINAPLSPEKKPQSILKQSSMVLSRSLSGISAIDFM